MNNLITKINNIPLVRKVLGEKATEEFIKYLIVGVSSFILDMTFLYIFTRMIENLVPGIAHSTAVPIANTASVTIVFGFNFVMNRYWTYRSTSNIWRQLLIYTPLFFFNLIASDAMVYLMIKYIGLFFLFAKAISIGVVICWNIPLYKKFIFK
ncbi:MAG TPA: GtrA family protein [Bacillota bacterium]|nr:GtrA family protein [Bacillota bacterium]